jgi:hypothetical protein
VTNDELECSRNSFLPSPGAAAISSRHFSILSRRPSRPGTHCSLSAGAASAYRGGLVFKAHRLLYHSTLGSRVMKKKEEEGAFTGDAASTR